jgi:hypothetical protein
MARKEKQYHFIYKTTNLVNCKYYYGMHSTNNLNDGYYGSGKRLRYSLNKYGKESHKVEHIEFLPNRKSLIEREKEIVNLNEIAKEDCMNLMVGGRGGLLNIEHGKRLNRLGNEAFLKKINNDVEFREKYKKIGSDRFKKMWKTGELKLCDWTGKHHTEESKRNIGVANSVHQMGEKNSMYGMCWITNGDESKPVKRDKLKEYLNNGWSLGRKIRK